MKKVIIKKTILALLIFVPTVSFGEVEIKGAKFSNDRELSVRIRNSSPLATDSQETITVLAKTVTDDRYKLIKTTEDVMAANAELEIFFTVPPMTKEVEIQLNDIKKVVTRDTGFKLYIVKFSDLISQSKSHGSIIDIKPKKGVKPAHCSCLVESKTGHIQAIEKIKNSKICSCSAHISINLKNNWTLGKFATGRCDQKNSWVSKLPKPNQSTLIFEASVVGPGTCSFDSIYLLGPKDSSQWTDALK